MIFNSDKNNGSQRFDAPASRPGFSLIELLVAIGIISVLIVIGIGVGMKVLGQSKDKATKANMAIIMNAIDTYYDEFDEYPGDTPTLGAGQTRTFHEFTDKDTDPSASMELWGYLRRPNYTPPKSRDKIKGLPNNVIENKNDIDAGDDDIARITFDLVDSYGNVMLYSPNSGLGGTPVIFSAGPDGKFGSVKNVYDDWVKYYDTVDAEWKIWGTSAEEVKKREEAAKDDIRSDK